LAQASARRASSLPATIWSESRCSTGISASALAICCSVACEQLPARHAAAPPTGKIAAAALVVDCFVGNGSDAHLALHLLGEMRDLETMGAALTAAQTGHLVLSSLHTNDAPSTISRLLNMGIEPFLVATSVHLICAQRLIRKVCSDCKMEIKTPLPALIKAGYSPDEAKTVRTFKGEGCKTCNDTGYKGRIGMYEVMEIGENIQELILVGASAREIRRKAEEEGMLSLRQSGLAKIKAGNTTLEEVLRETVLA